MRRKYCPAIGYTPPETTKSHVREFLVGEETLDRYLGSSIHIFLPHVPLLDFACLIPKGDFATMCLLGEDIDEELVQSFMKTPEFRECLPPEVIVQECSRCYPRLNICGAGEPFADRTVAIGDSGITRLCKDGIGTAYRTAKAAAALIKPGSRSPKGCSTAFRWRGGPIIPALPVPPTACRAPHPFRCASTTARGTWSTGRGPVAGSGVENAVFARDPLGDPWFCSVLHLDGHWVYPIVCGYMKD